MKTYNFGGVSVNAVKTEECDENYLEYLIISDNVVMGKVTKYGAEEHYTAWASFDPRFVIDTAPSLREATEKVLYQYKWEQRVGRLS